MVSEKMRQHHTGLNNNNEFDHVSYESLDGDILDEFSQIINTVIFNFIKGI